MLSYRHYNTFESTQKDEETIKELSSQIIKLGGKPNVDNKDLKEIIKNLSRQLEQLNVTSVLQDKTKNIIKDDKINNIKVRFQKVQDLPPKDLRKLVDNGKKELGDGIVIVFASSEDKVGLAVGITDKLVDKYDAVKFAKLGSETIGGKGGGGRKDFAQAGGQDKSKIDELTSKFKKKFISIDQTDKDGLIILSLSAKKAEHSQIVLSLIIKELEQTMKNRYLKDKENTMLSLERILIESQDNATKKIVQRIYNNEQSAFISGKTKENLIFEIIDPPHLPGTFHFPSRQRFLIFGFIFGFIFSYLYFFRKRIII